jgi:hypothetical protein
MKDQKTLKAIYKKDMEGYWIRRNGEVDTHMVDYCVKKAAYIVELDNGDYYVIDKPDIEKDFCFGYGYCGISDEEDYRQAADMAAHARTNENYFIKKNMEPLNRWIKDLQDLGTYAVTKRKNYMGQDDSCQLMNLSFIHVWDIDPEKTKQLTDKERAAVIAGYEEVKKQFTKRLNTYLKRYGLTKVHSWTYLSD